MGFLDGLRKYVDRFHLRNHRNEECKKKYNPDSDPTLDGVSTEVCEQTNAWLKGFQSPVRQMNPERFKVLILYICHLKNKQFEKMCARGASSKALSKNLRLFENSCLNSRTEINLIIEMET
jgi:hypothetical protein